MNRLIAGACFVVLTGFGASAWFVFNALGGDGFSKVPRWIPEWLEDIHYEFDNTNDYFGRPRKPPSMDRVLASVNAARLAIGMSPMARFVPCSEVVPNKFLPAEHFTRLMCPIGIGLGGIGLNMRFVQYDSPRKAAAVVHAWRTHLSSGESEYVYLPTVLRRFLKAQLWCTLSAEEIYRVNVGNCGSSKRWGS